MIVEDTTRGRVDSPMSATASRSPTRASAAPPTRRSFCHGPGMQMLAWDEGFCELLVAAGFRVVRYDNRDIGLSTKIGGGPPHVIAGAIGMTGSARYTLREMAARRRRSARPPRGRPRTRRRRLDGRHDRPDPRRPNPDRVASLCSIMSAPGAGGRDAADERHRHLLARPPAERNAYAPTWRRSSPGSALPATRRLARLRERSG